MNGARVLLALAVAAAAALRPGAAVGAANLAPNPDFEGPTLPYSTTGSGAFTLATDQAHSATHALKIVSTTAALNRWFSNTQAIPALPATQYTACAFVKTLGVGADAAYLSVDFWNASSVYIPATVDSPTKLSGTTDWTRVCVTTTSPAGTAYVRVEFRLSSPGTLWIDDVSVEVGSGGPPPQQVVVVGDGSGLDGWTLRGVDATGSSPSVYGATAKFVVGPATPPRGNGSVHLFTATHHGEEAATLRNGDYDGTRLDELQALRYCTYVQKNDGQQAPFLSLEVDANGDGTLDDRLFFEPPYQTPSTGNPSLPDQGAVQLFVWQCWDALAGGWWAASGDGGLNPGAGVKPLSAYLAAHPNAVLRNKPDGSGAIRVAVGFTTAGDTLNGDVDRFEIETAAVDRLYDFQPVQQGPPVTEVVRRPDLSTFGGWYFYDDTSDTATATPLAGKYELVDGPGTPPAGTGSIRFHPTGSERWNIATQALNQVPLDEFTALSYDTFQPSAGQGTSCASASSECAVYLNFDVDFGTGLPGYQNRLVYLPKVNGTVAFDTWQEWNAIAPDALWTWSRYAKGPDDVAGTADDESWPDGVTTEYRSWRDILASFPRARAGASGSSRLLFRAGEPYPNGFVGHVDKVTLGRAGFSRTTDFEAAPGAPASLAPDADFESDPSGSYSTAGTGAFSWATDQSFSPTHALKIVSATNTLNRWFSRTSAIAAVPGHTYTACAQMKLDRPTNVAGAAYVSVNFWSASQAYIPATVDSPTKLSNETAWTNVCVTATAPAGSAFLRVEFRLTAPAALWIDNVAVTSP